jgi:hypothetical protein
MAVLWIDDEPDDQGMDAEKLRQARQRLSIDGEKLLKSAYKLQESFRKPSEGSTSVNT